MTKDSSKPDLNRRTFLTASPLLVLGAAVAGTADVTLQATQQKPVVRTALSAEEAGIVAKAKMASDVVNFFGKGHNCAESGLSVALRFLNKPQELEWVATGFGGGLRNGDLCGFLTSGVMALGLHAGTLKMDAAAAKAACSTRVIEFWRWWTTVAPLRCSEITAAGKDQKVCLRLGQLAAAKLEELMSRTT